MWLWRVWLKSVEAVILLQVKRLVLFQGAPDIISCGKQGVY